MNILHNTSFLVVFGFLLITFFLGLYAGRDVKDFKDYVLGGKRFSNFAIILTILSTKFGAGAFLGEMCGFYKNGIIVLIASLGITIRDLLICLIGPRLVHFKNCLSLGDIFEKFYGKQAKIISGVISFLFCFCMIGLQLLSLAWFFEPYFKTYTKYIVVTISLALGIYSSIGGIKSVTFTDIFHFLVVFIFVPILASIILKNVGGIHSLITKFPIERLKILNHRKCSKYIINFICWTIVPSTLIDPAILQRILIAKSKIKIKYIFLSLSTFGLLFRILIMTIAFCFIVISPNIKCNNIYYVIFTDFIKSKNMILFFMISALTIILSTINSYLNTAGVILINDIISPFKKNIDKLKYTKIFTFIFSCFVNIILFSKNSSYMHLSSLGFRLSVPILMFPLIAILINFKTSKKEFYISAIAGIIGFLVGNNFFEKKFYLLPIMLGFLSNTCTFICMHIIQNKGISIINRNSNENTLQIFKPS